MNICLLPVLLSAALLCTACAAEPGGGSKASGSASGAYSGETLASNEYRQAQSSRPVASSSPGNSNLTASSETASDALKYWPPDELKAVKSLLAIADGKTPPDRLIHTVYPEQTLANEFLSFGFNPYGGNVLSLTGLNNRYPVECLRITSENSLYCVYKTKEGGRFYLFLFSDAPYSWTYNYSLYSKKALRYADFSAIKLGDPLSAVERIDPACSLYKIAYPVKQMITRHLLEDGILTIDYSRDSAGEYHVTKLTYSKDFQFKGSRVDDKDNHLTETCAILPQDKLG